MRLSYSALDTYNTCPLKYKYGNIDRIKEPKSKEAVFGTIIHSTLRYVHSPTLLPPTVEDAINFFSQNWNSAIYDNELEERAAFSMGVKMIQDYYKRNNPADFTIVDLESRFKIEIGDNETDQHTIAGTIDRIDRTENGYEIIDYKTGRKMPSQEKVDNDIQLSIYLRAFLERYPKERNNIENITVSLYFLKHGVKLSSKRTLEQLHELDRNILEVVKCIENGEFEPRLNPLCEWCGYQKICPLWKHKFAEERRVETEEVRAAIEEYLTIKSEVSEKKQQLMKLQEIVLRYMEQEGVDRVFGESGIIGKSLRKTYRYDEAKLREILEPLGRWDEVRKVDGILLKKMLSSLPSPTRHAIEGARVVDKESVSLTVKKGSVEVSDIEMIED